MHLFGLYQLQDLVYTLCENCKGNVEYNMESYGVIIVSESNQLDIELQKS